MTKKSRRVKRKGQPVRLSPAQMVRPGMGEAAAASLGKAVGSAPEEADLREEYRHVVGDLARIGMVTAAVLIVLVVLAFVI